MIVGFFVELKVDVLTDLVLFVLLVYVADEDGVAAPGSKLVGGWIFIVIVVLFFCHHQSYQRFFTSVENKQVNQGSRTGKTRRIFRTLLIYICHVFRRFLLFT